MTAFHNRIEPLRKQLASDDQPNNLLVSNRTNIYYLTGFTGSAGNLLVTPEAATLLTDARYTTQVQQECPGLDAEIQPTSGKLLDLVKDVTTKSNLKRLGYESPSIYKSAFDQLEEKLDSVELVPTSGIVESLRAIKDDTEIAAIRHSIQVNEQTFQTICSLLTADQTEREVGFNLEHQMRQLGASRCSFDPIVAVGANAALPHATPGATHIGENPLLLIDWGAEVNHYASDLSRVLVTSGKISDRFREVYDTVLAAQLAGIAAIRPGMAVQDVDAAARKVIEDAGFGPEFGHSLGHGIGLQVHEGPSLGPEREGTLAAGMVVTVEPGIYLPDWGGVRIEDDVLVTPDGCQVLSELPKELDACIVSL